MLILYLRNASLEWWGWGQREYKAKKDISHMMWCIIMMTLCLQQTIKGEWHIKYPFIQCIYWSCRTSLIILQVEAVVWRDVQKREQRNLSAWFSSWTYISIAKYLYREELIFMLLHPSSWWSIKKSGSLLRWSTNQGEGEVGNEKIWASSKGQYHFNTLP